MPFKPPVFISDYKRGNLTNIINAAIKSVKSRHLWECVLLGQIISLLICATGVTSQILSTDYKINIPTAQSFLNYLLLGIVFNVVRQYQQNGRQNPLKFWTLLRERGFKYLVIALVDVQANYLIVKAYQYTTLTSIQLLDCMIIPVVLVLSVLFLRVSYRLSHLIGVLICLSGVGFLIYSDLQQRQSAGTTPELSQQHSNKFLGDMLCLVAACLYGVSNVAQEYFVRTFDRFEFLAMLGFFGTIINGIQFMILEREEVQSFFHLSRDAWALVALFGLLMFCLYYFMTVVIKATSAVALNLSILSADFYALIFGLFLFKHQFNGLFILAFVLIINGVVVYSLYPPKTTTPTPCNVPGEGSDHVTTTSLGGPYEKMADEPETQIEIGMATGNHSSTVPEHPVVTA